MSLPTAMLSYQQPIPRDLVHRAAVAEVFLTDAAQVADDRYLVAAQWPRDHAMYHPDRAGVSDPLLFAETIRQSLVYLAHRFHGVPLTHRFIGCGIEFEITDPELLRIGATPLPVVLDVRWTWQSSRPLVGYGMRIDVVLTVGGRPCGRGGLRVVAVDDKRYSLLRRRIDVGPAVPAQRGYGRMAPDAVGRLRSKDSVLVRGEGAGEWWLELDLDHAILFDHPSDHAPLIAVLEGFRQLGHHLAAGPLPANGAPPMLLSLAADCLAFAELDRAIRLAVRENRPAPGRARARRLLIDAVQGATTLMTSRAVWSLPAAPAHRGAGFPAGASTASQICPTRADSPCRSTVDAV